MTSKTSKPNETAAEVYAARFAECKDLAERIGKRLDDHNLRQQANPQNWCFAGDLGHVMEQLAYVLAFLGDRSAVERHGFQY